MNHDTAIGLTQKLVPKSRRNGRPTDPTGVVTTPGMGSQALPNEGNDQHRMLSMVAERKGTSVPRGLTGRRPESACEVWNSEIAFSTEGPGALGRSYEAREPQRLQDRNTGPLIS